ncbi:phosphatase PAP2 family protein [Rhodopseudomonas pseudopalustris]|uniref:phosphatase PAP2 family protein n=1 Tax=Rhodopseudomonas pseudopalustris TaxID=1513892 RepID=UPI001587FA3A|nr:phosphatase PAP2 family protein [Rhodopseudomonas pseudopalustris]
MIWLLIALMACSAGIGLGLLGITIDFTSNLSLIAIAVGYCAVTVFYATVRRDVRLAAAMTSVGQLFLVLLIGLFLTYAATAVGLPLRDAELHAADQWLNFDRASYLAACAAIPGLISLLDAAYLTIQHQTVLVPLALILAGQQLRLQHFVLAFGLSLVATALIAVFVPAVDAMIYLDLAPHGVASLPPGTYTHIPTLEALRAGTMPTIRLNDLEGLITFPSFHTANGVLFAWALWRIRCLWIVGLVVNALMIASTPISGQHYLIDVIAGAGVAAAAIVAARRLADGVRDAKQPMATHAG